MLDNKISRPDIRKISSENKKLIAVNIEIPLNISQFLAIFDQFGGKTTSGQKSTFSQKYDIETPQNYILGPVRPPNPHKRVLTHGVHSNGCGAGPQKMTDLLNAKKVNIPIKGV